MASYMDIIVRGTDKASAVINGVGGSLDSASEKGGRFSNILVGIGQGLGQKVFGLVEQGASKVVGFLGDSMTAASDLNETTSKVGVVFGQAADKVLAFGKTSADSMGMSSNAALSAAGTYGNLFVSMGMIPDKAADMSTELVSLAGDLASFNNLSPEDVLEGLRAGLVGETEPLRRFGVNINEAAIQAKALDLGLIETKVDSLAVNDAQVKLEAAIKKTNAATKEHGAMSTEAKQAAIDEAKAQEALDAALTGTAQPLSASVKAQASYALILEQTKTAQGDFARTSSGMANQQRINAAKVENAQARMGKVLMDVATVAMPIFAQALDGAMTLLDQAATAAAPFIKTLQENLPPAIEAVKKGLDTIVPPIVQFAETVGGALQTGIQYFLDNGNALAALLAVLGGVVLVTVVPPFVAWAAATIAATLPLIAIAAAVLAAIVILNELGVLDWISQNLLPALQQAFTVITEQVLPPLVAAIQNIIDAILPPLTAALDFISSTILPALGTAFGVIKSVAEAVFPIIASQVQIAVGLIQTQFDILKAAIGVVQTIFEGVQGGIGKVWDGITGAVKGGVNGIIGLINILIGALNAIQLHLHFSLPNPLGGTLASANFDWNGFAIKSIPKLERGAWSVLEGIYHLHDREMVVPAGPAQAMRSLAAGGASSGGGGPLVYIANYSGGEKEDERLGRILERRTR